MNKTRKIQIHIYNHTKSLLKCSSCKSIYTLPKRIDIKFDKEFVVNELKDFKNHPGILNLKPPVRVNSHLEETINKIVSENSISSILNESKNFNEFLKNRRIPLEAKDTKKIIEDASKEIYVDDLEQYLSMEQRQKLEAIQENELENRINQKMYKWFPIDYTKRLSIVYLVSNFAPQYAVLKQIFHEIERRDPDFIPKHLFDFGSGVGTVMWAANSVWKSDIKEYFNVDVSRHMNELSELISRGGDYSRKPILSGIFYRQSLPASSKQKFNLVVSAFSFFELPNSKKRQEVLETLWKKVENDGYLVLVDQSNTYGYSLIMEARDYIIRKFCKHEENTLVENETASVTEESQEESQEEEKLFGHVFAPCPHDFVCPIKVDGSKCTFRASYYPLRFYEKNMANTPQNSQFSYVVFKKSQRNKDAKLWPRLVYRDPKKYPGYLQSWLCTKYGNFDQYIATKNRSIAMYRLLKYSKVGDNLPIDYQDSKIVRVEHKAVKEKRRNKEMNKDENKNINKDEINSSEKIGEV